jgi:hypothetical protein
MSTNKQATPIPTAAGECETRHCLNNKDNMDVFRWLASGTPPVALGFHPSQCILNLGRHLLSWILENYCVIQGRLSQIHQVRLVIEDPADDLMVPLACEKGRIFQSDFLVDLGFICGPEELYGPRA